MKQKRIGVIDHLLNVRELFKISHLIRDVLQDPAFVAFVANESAKDQDLAKVKRLVLDEALPSEEEILALMMAKSSTKAHSLVASITSDELRFKIGSLLKAALQKFILSTKPKLKFAAKADSNQQNSYYELMSFLNLTQHKVAFHNLPMCKIRKIVVHFDCKHIMLTPVFDSYVKASTMTFADVRKMLQGWIDFDFGFVIPSEYASVNYGSPKIDETTSYYLKSEENRKLHFFMDCESIVYLAKNLPEATAKPSDSFLKARSSHTFVKLELNNFCVAFYVVPRGKEQQALLPQCRQLLSDLLDKTVTIVHESSTFLHKTNEGLELQNLSQKAELKEDHLNNLMISVAASILTNWGQKPKMVCNFDNLLSSSFSQTFEKLRLASQVSISADCLNVMGLKDLSASLQKEKPRFLIIAFDNSKQIDAPFCYYDYIFKDYLTEIRSIFTADIPQLFAGHNLVYEKKATFHREFFKESSQVMQDFFLGKRTENEDSSETLGKEDVLVYELVDQPVSSQ